MAQGIAWLLATLLIGTGGVGDLVDDDPTPEVQAPDTPDADVQAEASVDDAVEATADVDTSVEDSEASAASSIVSASATVPAPDPVQTLEASTTGVHVQIGDYELHLDEPLDGRLVDQATAAGTDEAPMPAEDSPHAAAVEASESSENDDSVPAIAVAAPAAALAGAAAVQTSSSAPAWLRRLLGLPVLSAMYSRIKPDEVLDHETRAAIYEELCEVPGQSLQALCEDMDVARSTARHHVRKLEEAGLVDHAKLGRSRVHFPAGEKARALKRHLLDHDTRAAIARALDASPATISELADELDVNPGSVHFHVNKLVEADLVDRRENGHTEYRTVEAIDDGVAFEPVNA